MASISTTGACGDSRFGPIVATTDCRGGFDFTVLFESAILNIVPAACFLLLAPLRIFHLSRQPQKVLSSPIRAATLLVSVAFAAIQTALLVLVAKHQFVGGSVALASASLDLLSALAIVILVDLEHVRSLRPSFLASAYLFITLLLDIARVRTAWLVSDHQVYSACLSASFALKALLLALNSIEKRKWFLSNEKKHSTETVSGPFSRGLFTWLNGLLWKGHSGLLTGDGLPNVNERILSSEVATRFTNSWMGSPQSGKNALLFAVIKCLRLEIATIALPRLCVVGFSIAQPFLIGKCVTILQETTSLSENMGYGLIAATILRGGLMTLVFNHMMDLPLGGTDESSAMALMGSDIEMLAEYFYSSICETWANVLQLALATWLLQTQVGAVCIGPILVAITASFAMGNAVTTRQKDWLRATEKRINFTTSILGSIRNVKYLGLTEIMSDMIETLRIEELKVSTKFRQLSSIRVCMINSPLTFGQLVTLAAYAILALLQGSRGLAVSEAITSLSLISLMITPLSYLLMAIPDTFASIGCLNRIQEFLKAPSRLGAYFVFLFFWRFVPKNKTWLEQKLTEYIITEKRQLPRPFSADSTSTTGTSAIQLSMFPTSPPTQREVIISLQNVKFGWKTSPRQTPGITLSLESSPTGSVIILVGPVGCGKSTFLKGLAGETPVLEGELFIKYPDLAFCDETPWLSNSSIRSNIAGEDPSTFDSDWYRTVIGACALDLDLKNMAAGDETVVGSKGSKLSGGQRQRIAIARAVYARKRIACFDDVLSGLDNVTANHVFKNIFGPTGLLRRLGCMVFLATHTVHHLPQADLILVLGDDGQVAKQGRFSELQEEIDDFVHIEGIELTQTEEIDGLSELTNQAAESIRALSTDTKRQTTDLAVYKYYFSSLGWFRISILLFLFIVNAGMGGLGYIWVDLWSSSSDSATSSRLGYWLGLYGAFSVIQVLTLALAVFWTWVVIVPAASKNLHSVILSACMSAPMSFLSNIETGILVTRFSQDIRLVDMILPRGFISTGFQLFGSIAQGAVAIASLPYLAAALPPLIGVLVLIQRFYLKTSRQLRLLEIELKSPLYTHFIESLAGVTTIRAFSWTHATTNRMISKLDNAQKPYYLLLCVQRWLSLVLNLMVAAIAVLLVGASLALRTRVEPGLLGIALVMMMDLGLTLSELIQNWTLLETSLGAIARIKDFAEETPSEEMNSSIQTYNELSEWPTQGEIIFSDASIGWNHEAKPLIHKMNLHIRAGQKFGLCGRSGSGKSTLALSLLRLNETFSGKIEIDGKDISLLSRSTVRQHISCLGQEPFLFPGTVKQNADPLNMASSTEIIDALRSVGVWDALTTSHNSTDEVLLDSNLDESILSQGHKQLFCLARALLKRSKILILDEPTSSLDSETDAKVQKVIRESFVDCTVIMVAHRIHTLLDFDQVAVLSGGQLVEVGHPQELIIKKGEFATLLEFES
ncbi:hypothetical protein N7466_008251 [Penicillium verhagenii]|uniref:uncharacterized protein n=1 Tax=Penicillium verhagenii TaxID=1562060 RepID=UPI002544FB15|nr:uncharacterized protein N7466_008251 [Penicillium verhagenii]KAJ5924064.1 hypothetical protein N7466_008251 [Penicillium verhagenii]